MAIAPSMSQCLGVSVYLPVCLSVWVLWCANLFAMRVWYNKYYTRIHSHTQHTQTHTHTAQ